MNPRENQNVLYLVQNTFEPCVSQRTTNLKVIEEGRPSFGRVQCEALR